MFIGCAHRHHRQRRYVGVGGQKCERTVEEAFAALTDRIALRRVGTAEEMAAAYLFLASDESAFTTGTTLVADGGFIC